MFFWEKQSEFRCGAASEVPASLCREAGDLKESHEAGGSEGTDNGAGDELGPGFPDAPAGEDTGEPGVLGGHGILDVGFLILDL